MALLDEAKNIISGKDPDAPKPKNPDNRIDNIAQCQVIWYQWSSELASDPKQSFAGSLSIPTNGAPSDLAGSRSYDISNHIESFTFSKSLDNASGSFQFTLHNSFDWSRYMRPGQWVAIFLANDGTLKMPVETGTGGNSKNELALAGSGLTGPLVLAPTSALDSTPDLTQTKAGGKAIPTLPKGLDDNTFQSQQSYLRCVGIIQRVGITSRTSQDGSVEISYVITGKDFGTIYEDTEIWFNGNNADGAAFSAAIQSISSEFVRNINNLMEKWHDIFLSPSLAASIKEKNSATFFPTQWIMPDKLVSNLGLTIDPTSGGDPYFGSITGLKEFSPTIFENPDPFPLAAYNGRCWDKLKSLSNPDFHELFTELSDAGNPKLYFRPIPWGFDQSGYPTLSQYIYSFSDIATTTTVQPLSGTPAPSLTGTSDPLGDIVNVAQIASNFLSQVTPAVAPTDQRTIHGVAVDSIEVESFDVGIDIHSRANFFIVDNMKSIWDQLNSLVLAKSQVTNLPFPFRNEDDIKRNGFRPVFANVLALNINSSNAFGDSGSAQAKFLFEAAQLLKDYYATAEDLYSGTINLATGKNEIKLGKVLLTDGDLSGLPSMAFYIEGYTDSFNLDENGVGTWVQSLVVTRGISLHVLNDGGKIKDKQATQVKTFHAFNKPASTNTSPLSQAKSFITKPLG